MRINTNVGSLNAWRNLTATDGALSKNLERLSSGFRINRAGDDVAGLAISENMRAQIKGLNQSIKNAQDGISLLQTAEGSLNEVHSMLHRMRELSVQSANGTLQPEDRKQIQTEMDNLAKEVTRITNATQFNSMDLIDGSLRKDGIRDVNLQIGPNAGQTVGFEIGAMDASALGISRDVMTARVYTNTDPDVDPTTDDGISYSGGSVVKSVDLTGAIGAGLVEGEYQVQYDASADKVQLLDKDGVAIGSAVDVSALVEDGKVVIGDVNTAKTLEITLDDIDTLRGAGTNATDRIVIGARVATVADDGTALNLQDIVDSTGTGTGVSEVGWGLASGTYTLEFDDTNDVLSLVDDGGKTIGKVTAYNDTAGTYTVGDVATGRYVKVSVQGGLDTNGDVTDTIDVTNNEQGAYSAQFSDNVKYANSQAFAGLNVSSVEGAQAAIKAIDSAIGKVSYQRSQMGAITNRLEHTISNLQVVAENLTASESRIRDVDMALEMTQFTKQQILMQSGTAMLAQANQKNQAVLSLLR